MAFGRLSYTEDWRCRTKTFILTTTRPDMSFLLYTLSNNLTGMNAVWRLAMSEEVGKKMQAVVERLNLAVTRRPKVSFCELFS